MIHAVTGAGSFPGSSLVAALEERGDDVRNYGTLGFGTADIIWHCDMPDGSFHVCPGMIPVTVGDATGKLETAKRIGSKLVLLSTPDVYGRMGLMPLAEEDHLRVSLPYSPRTCHQIAHIAVEAMLMADPYQNIQIIRPCNLVGPGQDPEDGFVCARFHEQAKNGGQLTVFGDGSQHRTFTSVHDFVDFCLLLIDNWPAEKQIWNISGKKKFNRISMMSLAALFQKKYNRVGNPVSISSVSPPPGYSEVPEKPVTWGKASRFGFNPTRTLASIIKEMKNGDD